MRTGRFLKDQPQTEYAYGHTDTGKGGGSINTGSKGKPSDAPTEKPVNERKSPREEKKHDREIYEKMKEDDAFMASPSEPTTVRGTESGAYDGLDTGIQNEVNKYRQKEYLGN